MRCFKPLSPTLCAFSQFSRFFTDLVVFLLSERFSGKGWGRGYLGALSSSFQKTDKTFHCIQHEYTAMNGEYLLGVLA
jgi:hypothetical protein